MTFLCTLHWKVMQQNWKVDRTGRRFKIRTDRVLVFLKSSQLCRSEKMEWVQPRWDRKPVWFPRSHLSWVLDGWQFGICIYQTQSSSVFKTEYVTLLVTWINYKTHICLFEFAAFDRSFREIFITPVLKLYFYAWQNVKTPSGQPKLCTLGNSIFQTPLISDGAVQDVCKTLQADDLYTNWYLLFGYFKLRESGTMTESNLTARCGSFLRHVGNATWQICSLTYVAFFEGHDSRAKTHQFSLIRGGWLSRLKFILWKYNR